MTKIQKMSLQEAMDETFPKIKEVTIREGQDVENVEAVICVTVESMPIPYTPAEIENCSKCTARIWVSFTSPKSPPRICYHCYVIMTKSLDEGKGIEIGVSREVAELAAARRKLS